MSAHCKSGFQGETVHISLPSMPEFVSMARLSVASAANVMGFSIDNVEDLKVVVSEACTNALCHGCCNAETYDLYYRFYEDRLEICVEDKGDGYEPDAIEEPLLTGDQVGGFGLFIIKSLMDEVEVVSDKGVGTRITMIKYLRL